MDEGQLESMRLAGVQFAEASEHLGKQFTIVRQGVLQRRRRFHQPTRDAQLGRQLLDRSDEIAESVLVLDGQDLGRHLRGHVRVAVPVSAHPRSEADRESIGLERATKPGELLLDGVGERLDRLLEQLIEVVDGRPGLVDRSRAVVAELVGLPHEVDDFAHSPVDATLLSGGHP